MSAAMTRIPRIIVPKVDMWSTQRNRDVRPGSTLDQILPGTSQYL